MKIKYEAALEYERYKKMYEKSQDEILELQTTCQILEAKIAELNARGPIKEKVTVEVESGKWKLKYEELNAQMNLKIKELKK
jgi:hypothetical protein